MRRARLEKFEEQLPDAVDVMKRALRAGHPFSTCIKLVSEDMDEPISREFEQTFADINYGNDVRRALLGMLLARAELEPDGSGDGSADPEGDRRQPG